MFREELKKRFSEIFGFAKTTFDVPSESFEQDTLFIEVRDCFARSGQGRATARVTGDIIIFTQREKMPFGFFSKRIAQAKAALTNDLVFYDTDREVLGSSARMQNISERRTSFLFLFSTQYDPNHGSMTEIEFSEGG